MVTRDARAFSRDEVLTILGEVMDPEVPVLSVIELGIVRDVAVQGSRVEVTVTPTYSGCPALKVIERDIVDSLRKQGAADVRITTTHTPAWTTDWISAEAREKLRAYGIAPPGVASHDAPIGIGRRRPAVRCPFCGSTATALRSEFGSTACKAYHYCVSCHQPFEEFKTI